MVTGRVRYNDNPRKDGEKIKKVRILEIREVRKRKSEDNIHVV